MTTWVRSTPSSSKMRCCSSPQGWGGVGVWVVIGAPVRRWAWATARSTRSTPGVRPGRSVAHLRIAARTPVSPTPSTISADEQLGHRLRAAEDGAGPRKWKYIGTSL